MIEIWEAKDIAMVTAFFYELFRFFNTAQTTGNYLIWYPQDKTETAFCIEPLAIIAGSADEMAVSPIHGISDRDYRWLREEIRFEFRVIDLVTIPEAIAYLEGV